MTKKNRPGDQEGLLAQVREFFDEPMPEGVGWSHVFGSTLLFLIVLQLITGILLALTYSPSAASAYESVKYIDQYMIFGKFIRGLHHWSASAFVIVLVIHILRTFLYAAYKSPRRGTWMAGVLLLLVVLGFAFTGYLLPWDMKAYFATRVGIEVGASAPVFGPMIAKLIQGGNELGDLTLTRFYALHVVVLPLILLSLLGIHLYYVRVYKITPPWRKNDEAVHYQGAFFPKQFARDQVAVTVVFLLIAAMALKFGAPLEDKADPTNTTYIPGPDWYFYGLYQLLRIFQGPLEIFGTMILPTLFFLTLLTLPFWDKNPERALSKRRFVVVSGFTTFFVITLLTVWGGIEGAKEVAAGSKKETLAKTLAPDVTPVDPKAGLELFHRLRCASCHNNISKGVNIPPGLEFSGSKFKASWLQEYLQDPYRIRWADTNIRPVDRMPNFNLTQQEAKNITAFLIQNVDTKHIPATNIDWATPDSTAINNGLKLVAQYACTGCHVIGDKGAHLGPSLNQVAGKLQPDYIYDLILMPKKIIPGTPMKDNQLWEDEAQAIARYLNTLK